MSLKAVKWREWHGNNMGERKHTQIKLRRNNKSELTIRPSKFTYTGISTHRQTNANVNSMLFFVRTLIICLAFGL